jgi:hypothetical protein
VPVPPQLLIPLAYRRVSIVLSLLPTRLGGERSLLFGRNCWPVFPNQSETLHGTYLRVSVMFLLHRGVICCVSVSR